MERIERMKTVVAVAVLTVLAVAVLTALSSLFSSCSSSREANLEEAWRSPGGTRVVFVVLTCFADLRSRVEETEQEVRVLVTARNDTNGDCADTHEIVLSRPLGDRTLIDESDGEPVAVSVDERLREAPPGR